MTMSSEISRSPSSLDFRSLTHNGQGTHKHCSILKERWKLIIVSTHAESAGDICDVQDETDTEILEEAAMRTLDSCMPA